MLRNSSHTQVCDESDSNPMVDFLFNMVICLVVVLGFFAKARLDETFALVESPSTQNEVDATELDAFPRVVIDEEGQLTLDQVPVESADEIIGSLLSAAEQRPSSEQPKIVFQASREPSYGTVEDIKNELKAAGYSLLVLTQRKGEER